MLTALLDGVSFKRVFLAVSIMVAACGSAFSLYVAVAETGSAREDLPSIVVALPAFTPVVTQPAAPVVLQPQPIPILLDIAPAPQWPVTLTYREARDDQRFYRSWLAHENPGVKFRAIHAIVTGYCPCSICCGEDAHGITRTGVHTDIEPYGVACPESFLRRRVHIPGYKFESEPGKFWKTDDTGSALNEDWHDQRIYHFDVRFMSHDWAKRYWGRREMTVYIAE